jgi:hypothetical protein
MRAMMLGPEKNIPAAGWAQTVSQFGHLGETIFLHTFHHFFKNICRNHKISKLHYIVSNGGRNQPPFQTVERWSEAIQIYVGITKFQNYTTSFQMAVGTNRPFKRSNGGRRPSSAAGHLGGGWLAPTTVGNDNSGGSNYHLKRQLPFQTRSKSFLVFLFLMRLTFFQLKID